MPLQQGGERLFVAAPAKCLDEFVIAGRGVVCASGQAAHMPNDDL
jgi:hypothetical protein